MRHRHKWPGLYLLEGSHYGLGSSGAATPPRDYFFATSGDDTTGNGTALTPYKSITKANGLSLNPGDRLLFNGGDTFSGTLLPPSGVWVASYGTGKATLTANATNAITLAAVSSVTLDNLTVTTTDTGSTGTSGIAILVTGVSSNCTISNNTVNSAKNAAISLSTGSSGFSVVRNTITGSGDSGMIIQGLFHDVGFNTIANTGSNGSLVFGKHGIYMKAAGTSWLNASRVHDNTISAFTGGSGISLRREFIRCYNNIITQTTGSSPISYFEENPGTSGKTWLYNNKITGVVAGNSGIYIGPANTSAGVTTTVTSFVIANNTIVGAGADSAFDFSAEANGVDDEFPTSITLKNNGVTGVFTNAIITYPFSDSAVFSADFNGWWADAGDINSATYFEHNQSRLSYANWSSLPFNASNTANDRMTNSEVTAGYPANTSDWVDGGTTNVDTDLTYAPSGSGATLLYAGSAPDIGAITTDQVFVLTAPTSLTPGALSPTGTKAPGTVLTATKGVWVRVPTAYRFEWLRDTTTVIRDSGFHAAVTDTYTLQPADAAHTITCRVTAQNAAGNSVAAGITGSATVSIPGGGTALAPESIPGLTANQLVDLNRELLNDGSRKARNAFKSAWTVGALEVSPGAAAAAWAPTAANGWGKSNANPSGVDAVFLRTKFVAPITADGGTIPTGWSRATGTGSGNSKTDPWTLLQAKRNYIAGDDIRMAGGNYHAFKASDGTVYGSPAVSGEIPVSIDRGNAVGTAATFGTVTNPVRFRADDPTNRPKIKWLGTTVSDDILHITQSYVILDGLEVDGNAAAAPTFVGNIGIKILGTLSDATLIQHVAIVNCYAHEMKGNGIATEQGDYFRIDGNTVWRCGIGGASVPSGISYNVKGATVTADGYDGYHIYIVNNIVGGSEGPTSDGNGIIGDNGGGGSNITAPSILVKDNVVYWNGNRGIHMFRLNGSNHLVTHNTMHTNGLDGTATEPAAGTAGEASQNGGTTIWVNNLAVPYQGTGAIGTVPFQASGTSPTVTSFNNWFVPGRHANNAAYTASELFAVTGLTLTSTVPDNVTARQERQAPAPDREHFRPAAQPVSSPDTITVDGLTPIGTAKTKLAALVPPQAYLKGGGTGQMVAVNAAGVLAGGVFTGGHSAHMTGSTFGMPDMNPSDGVFDYVTWTGGKRAWLGDFNSNTIGAGKALGLGVAAGAGTDLLAIVYGCEAWKNNSLGDTVIPDVTSATLMGKHVTHFINWALAMKAAGHPITHASIHQEFKGRANLTAAHWAQTGLPLYNHAGTDLSLTDPASYGQFDWETDPTNYNPDTWTPNAPGIGAASNTGTAVYTKYYAWAVTKWYNVFYDAIKTYSGTDAAYINAIKVGGPHLAGGGSTSGTFTTLPLGDLAGTIAPYDINYFLFYYWLKYSHGFDFVSLDKSIVDSADDTHATIPYIVSHRDDMGTFIKVVDKALTNYPMLSKAVGSVTAPQALATKRAAPIHMIEFYFDVSLDRCAGRDPHTTGHPGYKESEQAMMELLMLIQLWTAPRVEKAHRWQPMCDVDTTTHVPTYGYFRDTNLVSTTNKALFDVTSSSSASGTKTALYDAAKLVVDNFSDGATLYNVVSADPELVCMATQTKLLVVSTNTTLTKTFTVEGVSKTLAPKKAAVYDLTKVVISGGGGHTFDPTTFLPGPPSFWGNLSVAATNPGWQPSLATFDPDNPFSPTQLYYQNALTPVIAGGRARNTLRGTVVDSGGNRYNYYPRSRGFDVTAIDFTDPAHLKVTAAAGHDITNGATIVLNDLVGRTDLKPATPPATGFVTVGQSLRPTIDRTATVTNVTGNVITLSTGWTPNGTYGAYNATSSDKNSGKYDDRAGHLGYISKYLLHDDYHEVVVTENNIATAGDAVGPYFTADGTIGGAATAGADGYWVWTGGYTNKWNITGNSPGSLKVRVPGNLDVMNASAEFIANGNNGDFQLYNPFNGVEWENCTVDVNGMSAQAMCGGSMAYSQQLAGQYLPQGEAISYSGVSGVFDGVINVGFCYDAHKAGSTCQTLRWVRCSNWRNTNAGDGGHTDCWQIFWLDNSELAPGVATWEYCTMQNGGNGMVFLNSADAGKSGAVIINCVARYCLVWRGNKFCDLALCQDCGAQFNWINDDPLTTKRPDPLDFGNGPPAHPFPTGTVIWPTSDNAMANRAVAADGTMSTTATHVQRATIPTGATFTYSN